jgi:hypothetical protein
MQPHNRPDTADQRISLEQAEIEAQGAAWAERSDAFLVGYVSGNRVAQFHTPAIVEMQRRATAATREFNQQSTRQADTMIRLTRWIIFLTVLVGLVALGQLIEMFLPKGGT